MTITLAAAAAVLYGCGTYLLLQRELTRIVIGLALLAHGANLLILLAAGDRGRPTFVGDGSDPGAYLDPLPQAFVLTAIVITFGVTTFLLGLAYRSWVLTRDDEVQDDLEDRRVAARRRPTEEEIDFAAVEAERVAQEEEAERRAQQEEAERAAEQAEAERVAAEEEAGRLAAEAEAERRAEQRASEPSDRIPNDDDREGGEA